MSVFVTIALSLFAVCPRERGPNSDIPADTLRILAYNIHHGSGMDELLDLERIAAIIRDADPDLSQCKKSIALRHEQTLSIRLLSWVASQDSSRCSAGSCRIRVARTAWRCCPVGPLPESNNLRLPDGEEPRTALSAKVTSPKTGRSLRFVGIHFYRTRPKSGSLRRCNWRNC